MVTPRPPGTRFSSPLWAKNTSVTAMARTPSRDGIAPVTSAVRSGARVTASRSNSLSGRRNRPQQRPGRRAKTRGNGQVRCPERQVQPVIEQAAGDSERGQRHDDKVNTAHAEPVTLRQISEGLLQVQGDVKSGLIAIECGELQRLTDECEH